MDYYAPYKVSAKYFKTMKKWNNKPFLIEEKDRKI